MDPVAVRRIREKKKQNTYILAAKEEDASKESTRKNQRSLEQTDQMKTDPFAVSCSHATLGRGHLSN